MKDKNLIIHVDMDAFFASVEELDNKELKGKPIIVGGINGRGVVSTCSYEARKYGIHSAMPTFMAQKLCPHGVFLKTRIWRYKEISEEIFKIFYEVTPLVEPLSIDEAYLDLSESKFTNGLEAGLFVKREVLKRVGLTLSVGISYNKFLAKIASDMKKPNGITIIEKEDVIKILAPLPISKIYGLGSKSVNKLNNMGFFKVEDLYDLSPELMVEYLGKWGWEIYERIRGIDKRDIKINRERKSYGRERTLKADTMEIEELAVHLRAFSEDIGDGLKRRGIQGRTVTLKYKTKEFVNHTRSKTLLHYTNDKDEIYNIALELLEIENLQEEVRLIGISVSSFMEEKMEQLTLF